MDNVYNFTLIVNAQINSKYKNKWLAKIQLIPQHIAGSIIEIHDCRISDLTYLI